MLPALVVPPKIRWAASVPAGSRQSRKVRGLSSSSSSRIRQGTLAAAAATAAYEGCDIFLFVYATKSLGRCGSRSENCPLDAKSTPF